jgi:Uma2 family endonuclease
MATDPIYTKKSWGWPSRGGAMSVEAYHELERLNPDRKYEYIAGLAYMMSGGSVGHDRITYNTRVALDFALRSGACNVFGPDVQVLLGAKRNGKPHFVYPDATVSCDEADRRADNQLIQTPRLVVEVLSPSTEIRDRGVKFKAYQTCPSIQEIVLVNQFAPYVEIWQRDALEESQWHYRHYGPGETIALQSISVDFQIEDLYRGIEFAPEDLDGE